MKIGIAGPLATSGLKKFFPNPESIPLGPGSYPLSHFVEAIACKGFEVSVYSLDSSVSRPTIFRGKGLTLFLGPYRRSHRIWNLEATECNYVRDLIASDDADIVHAHWSYEYALGALKSHKPTLVTFRDWAPLILKYQPDHYRLGRLLMDLRVKAQARHVAANSPYLASFLKRKPGRSVWVVPNGIPDSFFSDEIRSGAGSAPRLISSNNGFGQRKNVRALLEAFKFIRLRFPEASLALLGADFEEGGKAQKWARRRKCETGVKFLGPQPHSRAVELYKSSDLMIHPSREESFGMVLLEAMTQRTPVIGGQTSGAVPWVLDEGRAGVLTDVTRPEKIAESTIGILSDPEKWRFYSEAGYRHAWGHFRISTMADQYLKIYSEILHAG